MHIAIDLRPWCGRHKTGVEKYVSGLLTALFSLDTQNTYSLFVSGKQVNIDNIPWKDMPNVRIVHMDIVNKILHTSIVTTGRPYLDTYVTQKTGELVDIWFSPNIGFTALSPNVVHITTVHDLSFLLYPEFFTKKQQLWHCIVRPKKQIIRAQHIVVPSHNTKRDVMFYYGISEDNIHVLYPGVTYINDVELLKNLPAQYILYVGTYEPRKNIAGLIHAYKESRAYDLGCYLVIAGAPGWKCRDLKHMIQYTPGVMSFGYVSAKEKRGLYENAMACIFPSFYEGFGFPPIEAATYGCPVITSNRSSLPEVMGTSAYYVDPYNISDMATGIRRVITDISLRNQLAELGKKQVEKYQWENMARGLYKLFTI